MTPLPLWTAVDAGAATDGTPIGHWSATGVSIDTRTLQPGDLFVALEGPRFDGHDFVNDALKRGAAAAMVSQVPVGLETAPLLVVDDTFAGLNQLASYARLRSRARVIGITGSVGKTGTKEALKLGLDPQGRTHASASSHNNHWGVPLSLARMPADADFGVFELGMNHAGEIEPLSRLVKPDVAIITTIAAVHIENFDGVEGIADAKAEIFAGMAPPSAAVLNRDNPHFPRLQAHAQTQGISRIWSFGEHSSADARLLDCSLHPTASAVNAVIRGEPIQYSLAAPGKHWVMNSLAVLLAVKATGADVTTAARTLSRISPLKGRGARTRIRLDRAGGGAFLLIDESYNASPVSVAASLTVLAQADVGDAGRHIAVLGDMLELGEHAEPLHLGLKLPLMGAAIDLVFACGPNMRALYDTLPEQMRGGWAETSSELAPMVAGSVQAGDAVMVKGSLGSRMGLVVDTLANLDSSSGVPAEPPRRVVNGD